MKTRSELHDEEINFWKIGGDTAVLTWERENDHLQMPIINSAKLWFTMSSLWGTT